MPSRKRGDPHGVGDDKDAEHPEPHHKHGAHKGRHIAHLKESLCNIVPVIYLGNPLGTGELRGDVHEHILVGNRDAIACADGVVVLKPVQQGAKLIPQGFKPLPGGYVFAASHPGDFEDLRADLGVAPSGILLEEDGDLVYVPKFFNHAVDIQHQKPECPCYKEAGDQQKERGNIHKPVLEKALEAFP